MVMWTFHQGPGVLSTSSSDHSLRIGIGSDSLGRSFSGFPSGTSLLLPVGLTVLPQYSCGVVSFQSLAMRQSLYDLVP